MAELFCLQELSKRKRSNLHSASALLELPGKFFNQILKSKSKKNWAVCGHVYQ